MKAAEKHVSLLLLFLVGVRRGDEGRSQEEETAALFDNPISDVPSMLVCEKRVYYRAVKTIHSNYKRNKNNIRRREASMSVQHQTN